MIYDYSIDVKDNFVFGMEGIDTVEGKSTDMRYYQGIQAASYCTDNARLLNVGCNHDPARLSTLFENIVNLDSRDFDPQLEIEAERDLTKVPGFVKGDLRDMGYKDEFDCIVIGELLEHMTWRAVFQHLEASWLALKTNGVLIITTPEEHPCRLTARHPNRKYLEEMCGDGSWPSHVNWITPEQLKEALEWMGFNIVDFRVVKAFHSEKFLKGVGDTFSQKFINQNNQLLATAVKREEAKWHE